LCLAFGGGKWTLGGWCRLREACRNFRPDRMLHWDVTGERFADHASRNLAAYVASMQHPPAGMEEDAGGNRIPRPTGQLGDGPRRTAAQSRTGFRRWAARARGGGARPARAGA